MKTIFLAIFFIVLIATQSFGQQVQKKDVYTFPSEVMLELLLTKQGIDYGREKLNNYVLKLGSHRCIATIEKTALYLRAAFNANASLVRVNNFNKKYSWVRVYLDGDSLIVAQELEFQGGVTEEGLANFLALYDVMLDEVDEQLH